MRVGPAGVGVRKVVGGRTGAGPVMIRGAWALAARENARAAAVSRKMRGWGWMKTGGVGTKKTKTVRTMHRQTLDTEHDSNAKAVQLFISKQCQRTRNNIALLQFYRPQYYLLKQQSEEEDVTTSSKLRKHCFHR